MKIVILQEGTQIDFSGEYVGEEKIYNFIKKVDEDFSVRLSDKVDLKEYSKKVFNKAVVIAQTDDDQIVGMLAGYANDISKNQAYVSSLGVYKEYRRKGIGQELLIEFIRVCKRRGFSEIMLHTYLENKSAMSLYEKNGFKIVTVSGNRVEYIYTIKY